MVPEMAGLLHFKLERYPDAIKACRQLLEIQGLRLLREIQARIVIWRSYFEMYEHLSLSQLDEMHREYDALRIYLQRDTKLSPQKRERFANFTRLFYKLIRLLDNPVSSNETDALKALKDEVIQTPNFAYEDWLLRAIDKRGWRK